jgi:hypothetical protein
MVAKPWTSEERARILRQLEHAEEQGRLAADREDSDSEDAWDEKHDLFKAAYFEDLPRLVMSCCPFDGKPLVRTFDPFGFDGLWWHPDMPTEELPTCPHFCVLGGAVNYQGLPPRAGNVEIIPGPEIPFVYPRLLALPGVVAVISSLPMENGYLAYPIAYFAKRRPPGEQLVAGWRGTEHWWNEQLGGAHYRIENDKWDFDLRPWLQQGKVLWTTPGSDRSALSNEPWDGCPYLDLPGKPKAVRIWKDKCSYLFPPDGSSISPYDD